MSLPIGSSMTSFRMATPEAQATMQADRERLMAKYRAGTFDDQVRLFLGDFDQASGQTKDLIWALHDSMTMTPARAKDGVYGIHIEDVAADRDRTLRAVTKAASALFRDYDIDTSRRIDVTMGDGGTLRVNDDHPDGDRIEALINDSFLLRSAFARVLHDSALVEQVSRGPDGPSFAQSDVTLSLKGDGDDMFGLVRLFNELLASTAQKKQDAADQATLDGLLEAFDEQQEDRREAQDAERERAREMAAAELLQRQDYQNAYVQQMMAAREQAGQAGEAPPTRPAGPVFI